MSVGRAAFAVLTSWSGMATVLYVYAQASSCAELQYDVGALSGEEPMYTLGHVRGTNDIANVDDATTGYVAFTVSSGDVPSTLDLRPFDSPVYQHGACKAAYVMVYIATLEWHARKQSMPITSVSHQQVLACAKRTSKCSGGWAYDVLLEYARQKPVLTFELYPHDVRVLGHASAPLADACVRCQMPAATSPYGLTPQKWGLATTQCFDPSCHGIDLNLQRALKLRGPLMVVIDGSALPGYTGGVIAAASCSHINLNHEAVLVGYTADAWVLRNSWGPYWGEAGYFRIERHDDTNTCGIGFAALWMMLDD